MPRLFSFALTVLLLTAGCGEKPLPVPPAARGDSPLILLVVLDACRPDRLGCYGYGRETSPALDELARDPDSVLYHRHYVQGAWTKTSTASLFTGLFAFQHGVLEGHVPRDEEAEDGLYSTQILRDEFETLAERLGRLGFRTFAAVKSHHLVPGYGFAQGFDEYLTPHDLNTDPERVEGMLREIRESRGPLFGYLHLTACHHPFSPLYRHAGFMEDHGFDYDEAARAAAGVDFGRSETKSAILKGELRLEPDDLRFLDLVYDSKLRHTDETALRPLLRGLRELGVYDDMLLIVTADHGEELLEHGGYAHGHALWEEVVRVPLIVKFPGGRRPSLLGSEVSSVTQSIDLLPSLLSFSGAPVPEELPGTDIFGGTPRGFAYSEVKSGGWMIIREGFKYIEQDSGTYLFDLEADPGEGTNLVSEFPDRVGDMQAASEALRRRAAIVASEAPAVETELDEETREALRSLGYLE